MPVQKWAVQSSGQPDPNIKTCSQPIKNYNAGCPMFAHCREASKSDHPVNVFHIRPALDQTPEDAHVMHCELWYTRSRTELTFLEKFQRVARPEKFRRTRRTSENPKSARNMGKVTVTEVMLEPPKEALLGMDGWGGKAKSNPNKPGHDKGQDMPADMRVEGGAATFGVQKTTLPQVQATRSG